MLSLVSLCANEDNQRILELQRWFCFTDVRSVRIPTMPSAVVRRATLQDYQGVMDIGIMYDGMDYLPYFYKEFINDPDYLCYVCVVDGDIVGFDCALVHDGGRVAQARAGRVKESHRRKGYLQLMGEKIRKGIADFTSAKSLLFVRTMSAVNWATMNPAVKHIENSNLYEFSISKSRYHNTRPDSTVTRMYEKDLQVLFEATSVCHKLFPQDLIYLHHLPLGLHKANIKHIINDNTTVFATTSSSYTSSSNKYKNNPGSLVRAEDILLLTIAWHYRVPAGQRCSISVFGEDLETFDSHVQEHIKHSPSSDDHLNLAFYTSDTFPFETVMRIFAYYGTSSGFHLFPMCTFRWDLESRCVKAKY